MLKISRKLSHKWRKSRIMTKITGFLLAFAIMVTSLPMDGIYALAANDTVTQSESQTTTQPSSAEEVELVSVVRELTEYRNEFSKTFLMSDGTLESVVSSNPIHYSKDGKWQEIDSTLTLSTDEKGNQVYKNTSGAYSVELPASAQSGEEITITKGEKELSIKLIEAKNSKAKKDNSKKEKKQKLTKQQRKSMTASQLFEVDNTQTDSLEYTDVYSDASLRYDITPNEVKESIIINKAPNKKASYSYEITVNGLTAVLNSDGSVDFYSDAQNKEVAFHIPPPLMYDANDEYSYDIKTTLTEKKGIYTLTYKPDYDWLKSKDRAYPVVLDPSVVVNSSIQDSYTFSGEGYSDTYLGYEQQLKVGTTSWLTPNDYWQTYLKFNELPQIPYESYRIDGAYLMLTPKSATGAWTEMELAIYRIVEDWYNHQTGKVAERLTFNNAPITLDYTTATATVARGAIDMGVGFEIAHLVEDWYAHPDTNFGIKIAANLAENQYNDNIVFHSSRSTTGQIPYLTLTYSEYVPVTSLTISGKQERMKYLRSGNAFEVSATVLPENATNKEVVWESTDNSIAYYNDGYIWASGVGNVTITAKSADNEEILDSFELTVYNIPVTSLEITNRPENDTLAAGSSHQLSVIALPDNATDKDFVDNGDATIQWSSSDPSIAYVDGEGNVTAITHGTVTITAAYGAAEGACTITVPEVPTTSVDIHFSSDIISPVLVGDSYTFTGLVTPNSATEQRTVCTVDNPDVLTIETVFGENLSNYTTTFSFTAIGEGTATIRVAAYNDPTVYDEYTVTVYSNDIGVNIPENGVLKTGQSYQIAAHPLAQITVADPTVLRVDSNGYVTALKSGTTTLEICLRDDNNFVNRTITVVDTCELELQGLPTDNTIYVGEEHGGACAVKVPNISGDVVWYSDDESIAIVYDSYAHGVKMIGVNPGTVTVYVEVSGTDIWTSFELTVEAVKPTFVGIDTTEELNDGIIYFGEEAILTADVYPKTPFPATFNKVNWQCSDETAAQINFLTKYKYRFIPLGLADINVIAYIDDIVSPELPVSIKSPTATIKNKPGFADSVNDQYVISTGATHKLVGEYDPYYADIEWSSSNKNVVTIDQDTGEITASTNYNSSSNETIISFSVTLGDFTVTDTFTLKLVDLDSIFIEGLPSYKLTVGEKYALSVEAFPTGDYTENVIWSLNFDTIVHKDDVATLDSNGNLTLKSVGLTTIVVKSKLNDDIWDAVTVEVFPAPTGITITNKPSNDTLYVGDTHQLGYTITPTDALPYVKWSSSDPSVATIDPDTGKITAKNTGKTNITVKTANIQDKQASFTINIKLNRNFNTSYAQTLKTEFIALVGPKKPDYYSIIYYNSTEECLDIILKHDEYITNLCNKFNMQKAVLQSILFRELWCYNVADPVADTLVAEYFLYKEAYDEWRALPLYMQLGTEPTPPKIIKEDSSVGIGQIFASVAIKAYNNAIEKGIISGNQYDAVDVMDWKVNSQVWHKLRDDEEYNIMMALLNLFSCADYHNYNYNFRNYSSDQLKHLFTRYNAETTGINEYGEECYKYYQIFQKYQ